eukprot:TRINITY_DN2060_c0_g1_i1.p1 TRINITY_DN2060_c0_g1~~TRINITY_DN2060_c0_g1_i1.p1  ORF type:complete len:572 (+),score=55.25 TRINITY_DN2060_c0_g1_i1:196-1911(+)
MIKNFESKQASLVPKFVPPIIGLIANAGIFLVSLGAYIASEGTNQKYLTNALKSLAPMGKSALSILKLSYRFHKRRRNRNSDSWFNDFATMQAQLEAAEAANDIWVWCATRDELAASNYKDKAVEHFVTFLDDSVLRHKAEPAIIQILSQIVAHYNKIRYHNAIVQKSTCAFRKVLECLILKKEISDSNSLRDILNSIKASCEMPDYITISIAIRKTFRRRKEYQDGMIVKQAGIETNTRAELVANVLHARAWLFGKLDVSQQVDWYAEALKLYKPAEYVRMMLRNTHFTRVVPVWPCRAFIPPDVHVISATDKSVAKPIREVFRKFIASETRVLLVDGGALAGKSVACQYLIELSRHESLFIPILLNINGTDDSFYAQLDRLAQTQGAVLSQYLKKHPVPIIFFFERITTNPEDLVVKNFHSRVGSWPPGCKVKFVYYTRTSYIKALQNITSVWQKLFTGSNDLDSIQRWTIANPKRAREYFQLYFRNDKQKIATAMDVFSSVSPKPQSWGEYNKIAELVEPGRSRDDSIRMYYRNLIDHQCEFWILPWMNDLQSSTVFLNIIIIWIIIM